MSQRNQLQQAVPPHPATFRDDHLTIVRMMLAKAGIEMEHKPTILDPFAGIGVIHLLRDYGYETYGVEIEPEWAKASDFNAVGDSTKLRWVIEEQGWPEWFDAVVTSPTFGNRMADHHEARDDSIRNTYRHKLGRQLEENNSGRMQWGAQYRMLHDRVWGEVTQVTDVILLNLKDHVRKGEIIPVTAWHVGNLESKGFQVQGLHQITTRGNGFGENGSVRVGHESMILMRRV